MSIHCRKLFSIAGMALALGIFALPPGDAGADLGDCSQPFSTGAGPVASDCLFILQSATGSRDCLPSCTCDTNGDGPIVATDALLCLNETVGSAPLACSCLDIQGPSYAFGPGDVVTPNISGKFTAVDYAGAFPQDVQPTTGDWTQGWTISLHGNNTVWEPAVAPVANGTCPAGTTLLGAQDLPADVGGGSMDLCELDARYDSDGASVTLTNDNIYRLNTSGAQGTILGDGDAAGSTPGTAAVFTLNVDEGTLVLGSESEALSVSRGSILNLSGTATDPIVLGSVSWFENWVAGSDGTAPRGTWGGLVVTGFGEPNQCPASNPPCDAIAEGFLTPFLWGGNDNTISSGTMTYFVIRNAGFDIDGNGNELNGMTNFGVGRNTTIDYFQIHKNDDDGIEFFGGDVVATHGVLTGIGDDNIDSDLGFLGGVQFAVVDQFDDDGDRGFETDSSPNPADTPVSEPTWANVTVLGDVGNGGTSGIITRSTTGGHFWNGIVTGSSRSGWRVDDSTLSTRGLAGDGKLSMENYVLDTLATAANGDLEGESGVGGNETADLEAYFDTPALNNARGVEAPISATGYPTANP